MSAGEDQIEILFRKLADGTASAEEINRYYELCQLDELEAKIKALMSSELADGKFEGDEDMERLDQVYQAVRQQVQLVKSLPVLIKHWGKIMVAATAAAIILGAGFFIYTQKENTESLVYKNDVNPGRQGATLTLANGKRIKLSEASTGELAEEAGVVITKADNGELVYQVKGNEDQAGRINTLATANGETYRLRLPDGSTVWLNSASSLTYTSGLLKAGKRSVTLKGEAFFDIAKDKMHPFVVQARGQDVEVLGTQFNINSYQDEQAVATTLLEGSIRLSSGGHDIVINPGEQTLNKDGKIQVAEVNVKDFVDWKDGDFNLDELNFKVAMRKIARWYDVDVIFDESVPEDIRSGGWMSRSKKLSEVLKFIESSGIARFHLKGRTLYVSR